MSVSETLESKGHIRVQWAITILCNLSLLTYGLQCGWMSPMIKILQSKESPTGRPLSDSEISWIASVPSLAAVAGVLIFLQTVDRYGRKFSILLVIVFQALAWIITMLPASTTSLIIARISSGIASGGCFHVCPMYIKEIAQTHIRGILGSVTILAQSAGILLMYALGALLDYYTVLWVVVGIPILNFLLFLKAPESPEYLVKKGKIEEAASTLAFLRGMDVTHKEIQNEIDAIKKNDEYFKSIPNISIVTVFKTKAWRKALIVMFLVMLGRAANGSFTILNYAATLLSNSGVSISPELQSLSIPICMTVGSFMLMVFVDRLGRKPILATAFGVSAICFAFMAISIVLQRYGWTTPGWLNVTMIMLPIFCYGCGLSPIPFMVMPEIFNFQIRAKLMGYLVILAWFIAFAQLITFSALTSNFGAHIGYFMFVVINVFSAAVVVFMLPETKGKTVEQIESELRGDKKKETEFIDA